MQSVFIIFISLGISVPLVRFVAKNEPNKNDLHLLLEKVLEDFGLDGQLEFLKLIEKDKIKIYRYTLKDQEISVIVERANLLEFPL